MAYGQQDTDESADRIYVVNGELRGVCIPLENFPLRIGLSGGCDVILLDDGQGDSEITLDLSEKGKPTLAGAIGDVSLGRRSLKAQDKVVFGHGSSLHVGSSQLVLASSLSAADHSIRSGRRAHGGTFWATSLALVVGMIGVIGLTGGIGGVVAKSISPYEIADRVTEPSDATSSSAAVAALRQKLDEVGLNNVRSFEDSDTMTVSVVGTLQESQRRKWQEVHAWFDARYGTKMLMDVDVDYASNSVTLPFSIEAIWGGASPRITLHDGSRRGVGELLPGDWRLDKVTSVRILQ